jgi:UDP-N-acetylmuramoylalanine--D-glutamate ligase
VIDKYLKAPKQALGATLHPYGLTQHYCLPIGEDELALKGRHNVLNSMAATLAAQVLDIKKEVIRESLKTFQGVEHRLQYITTIRGVRWINDSKATNVNSCWYALESMTTPTVLIIGGTDKGNDYSEIDQLVRAKCHTIIALGVNNEKIIQHFSQSTFAGLTLINTHSLQEAVQAAYEAAHEGDTVLLSPCCASFDLFKSYEDRGEQFMAAVRAL